MQSVDTTLSHTPETIIEKDFKLIKTHPLHKYTQESWKTSNLTCYIHRHTTFFVAKKHTSSNTNNAWYFWIQHLQESIHSS